MSFLREHPIRGGACLFELILMDTPPPARTTQMFRKLSTPMVRLCDWTGTRSTCPRSRDRRAGADSRGGRRDPVTQECHPPTQPASYRRLDSVFRRLYTLVSRLHWAHLHAGGLTIGGWRSVWGMERFQDKVLSWLVVLGEILEMIPERYEPASLLFILIVLIIWLNRDSKRNTTRGKSHKFKGLLPQIDNCIEVLNERLKQGNFVFVRGVELTVNCQNLANELGILDVAHPDLELDLDKDIVVAFWLDYLYRDGNDLTVGPRRSCV